MEDIVVIAHRTCPRHAAENSTVGIRKAGDLGADGVEVDVRLSRDGVPVLVHDRTLWRYLRRPFPSRWYTAATLTGRPRRDSGVPIETFAAGLEALPDGVFMAIDVKEAGAARATMDEIRRQSAQERVLLWAKSMAAVRAFAEDEPGIERALLRDTSTSWTTRRFLRDAERCGAQAVSAHWDVIAPGFIAEAHGRGLKVYAMAPNPETQGAKLALGLDGIVTNWPEEAIQAVRDARA